ncbi:MAG: Hpt domain-containing protein [Nocardioides sp.]|nr:Hpt domain-containing protein [Nocardioides sp.]
MSAPVLDDQALVRLADSVDDTRAAARFAARFVQLLPTRIARISDALLVGDVEAALDASLSLKVTSCTAGARELQELAVVIEGDLRSSAIPAARSHAGALPAAADRACAALERYLTA